MSWESVTNPLDRLRRGVNALLQAVGNQLPILLIDFPPPAGLTAVCWESVTNPLDRLPRPERSTDQPLGISYQSS